MTNARRQAVLPAGSDLFVTRTEEQWHALLRLSFASLRQFLEAANTDPQAIARAKLANTFISSYTRHEATASAREQTRLIIGRQLAENPEQFREFVRLAMPDVPLVEAASSTPLRREPNLPKGPPELPS